MTDIGQDARALIVKALEIEIQIDEYRLAQKRTLIEIHRAEKRVEECHVNLKNFDDMIAARTVDLESLKTAAREAGGEI